MGICGNATVLTARSRAVSLRRLHRPGMLCIAGVQIGIKRRADEAQSCPHLIPHPKPAAIDLDQTVFRQWLKARPYVSKRVCGFSKAGRNIGKINLKVTHQPLDGSTTQAIIDTKRHPARDGKSITAQRRTPLGDSRDILHITLRQGADGRGP